jgi:hypothetical protein
VIDIEFSHSLRPSADMHNPVHECPPNQTLATEQFPVTGAGNPLRDSARQAAE